MHVCVNTSLEGYAFAYMRVFFLCFCVLLMGSEKYNLCV